MAVVEVMTGFEVGGSGGLGVEEAVGGIERPDSGGHREEGGGGEVHVAGAGDEPGPEYGDGGGVEGEEVPESEGGFAGHFFILGSGSFGLTID